jgi:hypothetical protein
MKNPLLFTVLLAFTLSLSSSFAQEVIPATGGNAEGSGGSVSFSIGQLFFNTHKGTDGSVSEGVQQPWEISVVTGIQEAFGINLVVSAFPIPATDFLILRIENFDFENFDYLLYDVSGRLLKEGKVTSSETTISMTILVPAVYFLKVIRTSPSYQEVKTFRIIKN